MKNRCQRMHRLTNVATNIVVTKVFCVGFSDLASAEKSVKKRTQFFSNCKTGTRSSKFVFYGCTFWKHQLGVPKTFYNIGPRIKLFSQMMTKCYDNEMNVFLPFSRLIIPRKKELAALLQVLIICTLRTLAFLKQWAKPGLFCLFSVFFTWRI